MIDEILKWWKKRAWYTKISIIICFILFIFLVTPIGRTLGNKWVFTVQKADDATNYRTIKEVEDTCRAMISSYTSDKITYEQYKDSENKEQQSWAEQAKMRANKTAASYNEYILKNSFVWKENIPSDIKNKLEYLQ